MCQPSHQPLSLTNNEGCLIREEHRGPSPPTMRLSKSKPCGLLTLGEDRLSCHGASQQPHLDAAATYSRGGETDTGTSLQASGSFRRWLFWMTTNDVAEFLVLGWRGLPRSSRSLEIVNFARSAEAFPSRRYRAVVYANSPCQCTCGLVSLLAQRHDLPPLLGTGGMTWMTWSFSVFRMSLICTIGLLKYCGQDAQNWIF